MKCFAHSGDLGDVLFALPTIRALGGGDVVLYPDRRVREAFTVERAHNLGVLLGEQPYVRRWRFSPASPAADEVAYDFGRDWRTAYLKAGGHENLAHSQARAFGVDPAVADVPWLHVERPAAMGRVVFIRSHRYRQPGFPWAALADLYRKEAVTLGVQSEAEELFHQFGLTNHVVTATLAEMARVIAGAELVVTNQTAGYAIAEGLKKTVILERCPHCPNVDFDRPGVIHGARLGPFLEAGGRLPLPGPAPTLNPTPAAPPAIRGVRELQEA